MTPREQQPPATGRIGRGSLGLIRRPGFGPALQRLLAVVAIGAGATLWLDPRLVLLAVGALLLVDSFIPAPRRRVG